MRVLIADDHKMMRDGLRAVLEKAGIVVCGEAAEGFEAVELAQSLQPQIIVMDISMPLLNVSPTVAATVVVDWMAPQTAIATDKPLSAREREVLQLLAEGNSSKDIAKLLGVAVPTIETHRRQIMGKLKLHSIAELTKFAIREGLTSLE
jgi:DNA-binding NarL/FixJ family response regulator